jgi:transposase InsO family protein
VYHINAVDEVTQWQVVGATEQISEAYLQPVLQAVLAQFPFRIRGFHSDNGSEFINYTVAKLLNKLLIEQTKSRPRHCNDNGLAEAKNGAVVLTLRRRGTQTLSFDKETLASTLLASTWGTPTSRQYMRQRSKPFMKGTSTRI